MTTLAAEALVAVSGAFPDEPLTRTLGLAAKAMPKQFRDAVQEFLDQGAPAKFRGFKTRDFEKTWDELNQELDPELAAKLIENLAEQELAQEYQLVLKNAREYLRGRWPVLSVSTATGPKILPPSTMAETNAWALYAIVADPLRLLQQIQAGALTADMVTAFRTVYPNLYGMLIAILDEEIVTRMARKKSYSIPSGKTRVIRLLKQQTVTSPVSKVEQPPAKLAQPKIDIDFSSTRTKAQQLGAR